MSVAARRRMSDSKPPAIEFRNVFLSFDDRTVLNDVSFTLAEGEISSLYVTKKTHEIDYLAHFRAEESEV